MVRVVGYAVALGLLVTGLFGPAWWTWTDDPAVAAGLATQGAPEPTTITDYDARFDLRPDGDLVVEERLIVAFAPYDARTGIVRSFDTVDGSDERVRRVVDDLTATLDGDPVPVRRSSAGHGRFDVATIGDPDVAVEPGEHRVVLRYRVPDVVEPGYAGSPGSLHWDLVPASWQQDVEQAVLTVSLPAPARDVQCGIGTGAYPAACDDVTGTDTTTLVVRTGALPAHTPVAVRLGVDLEPTDAGHLPWEPRYDVVLGRSVPVLAAVLGAAVVAGLLGLLLVRRDRGRRPRAEPRDEPPADLGPAQAAYALTGRTDRRHYVASLVHAGRHGALDIARTEAGWSVTDRSGGFGWSAVDPVTRRVGDLLDGPGTSFTVDPTSAASGRRLAAELAAFAARTEAWARAEGLVVTARPSRVPLLAVALGLGAAVAAATWNPFDLSLTGLVPGAFAVALLPLLGARPAVRRTAAGRELQRDVAGFERTLEGRTDEGLDVAGREGRYADHLPYAVALGCADAWTTTFREATGHEPPATPSASTVAELDASCAAALATYDSARAAVPGRRRRRR